MSNTKNQNTLFRFVSLRGPEMSDIVGQRDRFVFHPFYSDSPTDGGVFINTIQDIDEPATNWQLLTAESEMFADTSFKTVEDIRQYSGNLYDDFYTVAFWLARNKAKVKIEDILEGVGTANITLTGTLLLWDNLFYQIITQKSFYVKEAVIEMLVLANLLLRLDGKTDGEKKELLPALMHATIVLPPQLFGESETTASLLFKNSTPDLIMGMPFPSQAIIDAHEIFASKLKVEQYQKVVFELEKLESKYKKGVELEYATQAAAHRAITEPLIQAYNNDVTVARRSMCELPKNADYALWDFCNQPNVPFPTLPKFEFQYSKDELEKLVTDMTKENYEILSSFDEFAEFRSFQDAIRFLQDMASRENKNSYLKNKYSRDMMVVGDAVIPVPDDKSALADFTFQICSSQRGSNYFPYLIVQVPNSSYQVLPPSMGGLVYTVVFENGTTRSGDYFEILASDNIIKLTNMFGPNDGILLPGTSPLSKIYGTLKFLNGVEKEFEILNFKMDKGFCTTWSKLTSPAVGPATGPIKNSFIPLGFGYRQLGIADFKKVVTEICCYDAGEVAHIENVMATEYKEKTTEKTYTKETTLFESQETETESLSDTTTAQRFEMQTEIAKLLQEQRQNESHANVRAEYDGVTLDAGTSYASNTSKEESNRQAVTQSKELTQRAMERIVSRIKTEKTVKITESFKEINSHIFDNRGAGATNVSGVYRFVNAIYKNQVYNYGKRLMYEFMVPEPSRLHRLALDSKSKLKEPEDPRPIMEHIPNEGTAFSGFDPAAYLHLATAYDANVRQFPLREIILNKNFAGGTDLVAETYTLHGEASSESVNLEIPEGYVTKHACIKLSALHDSSVQNYNVIGLVVGNIDIFDPIATTPAGIADSGPTRRIIIDTEFPTNNFPPGSEPRTLDAYSKIISVAYQSLKNVGFNISVSIKCELTADGIAKWKKETIEAIITGYNEKLRVYNEQVAEEIANGIQILDSNPLFHRQTEQLILRKNCISYLLDDSSTSPRRFGQDMYNAGADFRNAQVGMTQAMDDYTSFSKFMEQAFEWNLIAYNFYPFYWGSKDNWDKLYEFKSDDLTFKNFMQAGMARVVVTVKPGFEFAVLHYMAFGQIWNGGQIPVLGDPLYLSIVDEVREQEYTIDEQWETVLPTNLIALQDDGVSLPGVGLPCSPDCEEAEQSNPFLTGKLKLTRLETAPPAQ